jgi:hypothetical protein
MGAYTWFRSVVCNALQQQQENVRLTSRCIFSTAQCTGLLLLEQLEGFDKRFEYLMQKPVSKHSKK